MGRSKKKELEMLAIKDKIIQMNITPPVYLRNLSLELNITQSFCLKVLKEYNLDYLLGTKEDQERFVHQLRSEKAIEREKSFKEFNRKVEICQKGAQTYKEKYKEKKLKNPNVWYSSHSNMITPEVEERRRKKISYAEKKRTQEEWQIITDKRKKTMLSKDYTESRKRQGQSLKNTLSKYTEEQWKEKGLKISEGRKRAYTLESPEHKRQTQEKISNTCLKRYGVKWYTLSDEIYEKNNCVSKINKNIAKKLKEKGIEFSQEYRLENYSYDFKINNYLIEIDSTPTHNLTWSPYGKETIIPIDYHRKKSLVAQNNGFVCLHIFDWMSLDYYLPLIVSNDLYVKDKKNISIYYYNLKEKKLEGGESNLTVRVADDGFEICSYKKDNA